MKSIAVSNKMLKAAQDSYYEKSHPSYGLTDSDMKVAIKAALENAPDILSAKHKADIKEQNRLAEKTRKLAYDCDLAAGTLRNHGAFPTGEGILRQAADTLRALPATRAEVSAAEAVADQLAERLKGFSLEHGFDDQDWEALAAHEKLKGEV